jgi:hypothetical protein
MNIIFSAPFKNNYKSPLKVSLSSVSTWVEF